MIRLENGQIYEPDAQMHLVNHDFPWLWAVHNLWPFRFLTEIADSPGRINALLRQPRRAWNSVWIRVEDNHHYTEVRELHLEDVPGNRRLADVLGVPPSRGRDKILNIAHCSYVLDDEEPSELLILCPPDGIPSLNELVWDASSHAHRATT